ncbi:MAG: TonB-dependent receptor [Gammaproteobacteria bacterium]|nr:TonB-dependent receptor [Gammaproteobacteria bacterium]
MHAYANMNQFDDDELFSLSLEELLMVEVETRKTKENLAVVPLSNTLITHHQMQQHNISSIYELAEFVPNFSYRRSFGKLQERGVTRGVANVTGENVTGVFIDGMAVNGLINSLDLSQFKYAEVVRGPQATLYGRSTFAGAVNLTTGNPLEQLNTSASVSIGQEQRIRTTIQFGHKISEQLALQFTASTRQKSGEYNNALGDGAGSLNEQKNQSLSIISGFKIDEFALDGKITFIHSNDDDSPYATTLQLSDKNNCFLDAGRQYFCGQLEAPNTIGYNNLGLSNINGDVGYQNTFNLLNSHLNFKVNESHTLKLNNSFSEQQQAYLVDGDYSSVEFYWADNQLDRDSVTAELQWASTWSDSLNSLIGVFYQTNETFNVSNAYYPPSQSPTPSPLRDEHLKLENLALFSSVTYQLDSQSDIIADLRIAEETVSFDHQVQSGQQTFNTLSPKLTYRYAYDEKTNVYASISNGTKPGGFNPSIWNDALNGANQLIRDRYRTFDQESLWQSEIGIKGRSASNKLSYSLNVFVAQWDDLQTSQSITFDLNDGSTKSEGIVSNSGEADTHGVELEVKQQHTSRLNSWWHIGYAHTEFVDSETSAQKELTGVGSINGNQIPNSPELTGALGVQYQTSHAQWHIRYNSSIHHESARFVAEHNLAEVPAINKLRLGITADMSNWNVSLHTTIAEHSNHIESAARLGDPTTFFRLRAFGLSLSDSNFTELTIKYQF